MCCCVCTLAKKRSDMRRASTVVAVASQKSTRANHFNNNNKLLFSRSFALLSSLISCLSQFTCFITKHCHCCASFPCCRIERASIKVVAEFVWAKRCWCNMVQPPSQRLDRGFEIQTKSRRPVPFLQRASYSRNSRG